MEKLHLPSFESYGDYGANYGINALKITFPSLTLFYSYKTIVAFRDREAFDGKLVVSENVWGVTTGKHLNWLDGGNKQSRIPNERFSEMLAEVIDRHFV